MVQPATLRLESNGGQESTTYFSREDVQIALMLQLRMVMVQLAILDLEIHSCH
jgi:hypothetical protein